MDRRTVVRGSGVSMLQFRYSPVDYRPAWGRPTEKGNPPEDANLTTDKLARRHDDTCKMGRQEAGLRVWRGPPRRRWDSKLGSRQSNFLRSTDWTIVVGIVAGSPWINFPGTGWGEVASRTMKIVAIRRIWEEWFYRSRLLCTCKSVWRQMYDTTWTRDG